MKNGDWKIVFVLCFLFLQSFMFGQGRNYSWDFSDCDIGDIVFAISMDTGISIVTDDTVSGKGSFRFSGKDFETAFDSFLKGARLYVSKEKNVWTVSRFKLQSTAEGYSLDAFDLNPSLLLEKICQETNAAITYENLPAGVITVHFKNLTFPELMEKLAMRFQGYEVTVTPNGFHFGKKSNGFRETDSGNGFVKLECNKNGDFSLDAKDIKVSEVLEKLFKLKTDAQFCVLANAEVKIVRCCFMAEDFDSLLEKFCNLNGFSVIKKNQMYYLTGNSSARDKLLSENREWRIYTTKYMKAEKLVQLINRKLGIMEILLLPDEFSVLCQVSENEGAEIEELIRLVDLKTETYVVKLNYLKPSEFLNQLPPSVDRSSVSAAEDKLCIYFKGTEEAYENLCVQIGILDRPVPRISYDLLILQCDEGSEGLWSSSVDVRTLRAGDRNTGALQLGKVMNLNLNVITSFGLDFAAGLQSSIEENKTKVYADTKLFGVSGKKINFQNTNTYRYRDNNLDPDTGKPVYSGITKEIISGLKLEVLGVVSNDKSITSTVTASFTRQGTDTSSLTGNPPPTTEKLVTTEVRGKSGEPIVLSGLIQNSSIEIGSRTPFISKIPFVGNLFKAKDSIGENSQMMIYLVPHLEGEEKEAVEEIVYDGKWAEEKIRKLIEITGRGNENE
ncbi:MAG: type II and III secretion system protein [Treponema sp.]|nr:type II and III secretion system protein [Treponema sp.]